MARALALSCGGVTVSVRIAWALHELVLFRPAFQFTGLLTTWAISDRELRDGLQQAVPMLGVLAQLETNAGCVFVQRLYRAGEAELSRTEMKFQRRGNHRRANQIVANHMAVNFLAIPSGLSAAGRAVGRIGGFFRTSVVQGDGGSADAENHRGQDEADGS